MTALGLCPARWGEQCSYITPDYTYGDDWTSSESCQEYMVLEMPTPGVDYGGETMSVQLFATVYDYQPATESECELTKVEIAAYNWDENGDMYEVIGTASKTGTWNGSSCSLGFVFLHTTLNCNSAGCEMHPMVAARAYRKNAFGLPIIKRVVLGADRTDM